MAKSRSRYYDDDEDDDFPWYPPSRPIPVAGGIKAKSQRGDFTKSWWADRWIKALTRLMDSGRLQRGRSYARQGQVRQITVTPGHVAASVQGSRPRPYKVGIDLKPLTDEQWDVVFDALAGQAIFAAQLLNGEMPGDVEQVFEAVRVPLFPGSKGDLLTDCSCPDSANPCKHIAAVYYLLGERFDQDPFLLFELRGRTKEQVAAALRKRRAAEKPSGPTPDTPEEPEPAAALDLAGDLDRFWSPGPAAGDLHLNLAHPAVELAVLKRMGMPEVPGLRPSDLKAQLIRVYDAVTERALQIAFQDRDQDG